MPIVETVKRLNPEGIIEDTLDREQLAVAQTPQGFSKDLLEKSYNWLDQQTDAVMFTDEAQLVSRARNRIKTMPGEEKNIKITKPDDLTQ